MEREKGMANISFLTPLFGWKVDDATSVELWAPRIVFSTELNPLCAVDQWRTWCVPRRISKNVDDKVHPIRHTLEIRLGITTRFDEVGRTINNYRILAPWEMRHRLVVAVMVMSSWVTLLLLTKNWLSQVLGKRQVVQCREFFRNNPKWWRWWCSLKQNSFIPIKQDTAFDSLVLMTKKQTQHNTYRLGELVLNTMNLVSLCVNEYFACLVCVFVAYTTQNSLDLGTQCLTNLPLRSCTGQRPIEHLTRNTG